MTDGLPGLRFLTVALTLALASAVWLHPRDAAAEVAGRYKVTGTAVKVKVKSWGEDCGPRPRSSSARGGKTVEVTRAGAHLVLAGHRTDQCWSSNPKVQRRRASASEGRWEVVCETPADDPRFEHGEYTLQATSADTLQFVEESTYSWRLEGDHCEAIIHLTRTYERAAEGGGGEPPPEPTPAAARRCTEPGPPVKLDVRPARARVAPGERICLRASSRDAEGCRSDVSAVWARAQGGPEGRLGEDGCFTAGTDVGRVEVTATAGSLSATATVEVAFPDIGDLIAAGLAEGGDDLEPIAPETAPLQARPGAVQGVGGATADGGEGSSGLLWVVVAAAAGAGLLLAIVAVLLVRRGRRRDSEADVGEVARPSSRVVATAQPPPSAAAGRVCPTCHREFDGETFYCPHDATELVPSTDGERGAGRGENRICPKCRRGFPPSERVCPNDHEELVPYSVWRATQLQRRGVSEATSGMICPKCAARYDQEVQYCQKDGSKLVPIN